MQMKLPTLKMKKKFYKGKTKALIENKYKFNSENVSYLGI
jgi:hypothetical protein